jgi:hypothetical protein
MNRPALEKAIKDETEVAVTLERYIGRNKIPVCRRAVVLAVKVPRDPFQGERHRPSGVRVKFVDEPLDKDAPGAYFGRGRALLEQGSKVTVTSREVYEHWPVYAPIKAQRDRERVDAEALAKADQSKVAAVRDHLGVGRARPQSRPIRYGFEVEPQDLDALLERLFLELGE